MEVRRELIGVPAEVGVSAVDVEASEPPGDRGQQEVVFPGMSGEGRVVALDVELEAVEKTELPQESESSRGVEVVLMRRRLHRLGLDEKSAGEAEDRKSVV